MSTVLMWPTDGSVTLDGSGLPALTNFVSNAIDLRDLNEITLYVAAPDVVTAMSAKYETSPDKSNWFDGSVSIANLDNNKQVIDVSEKAIRWLRVSVNNSNSESAAVVVAVVAREKE